MRPKLFLICILFISSLAGFTQTDKYTDKLQKFYGEGDYYKVIDYKKKKEPEMESVSLYFKGLAYFMIDRETKAVDYFDAAIDKGPPMAEMYFFKGICHVINDEFDDAVDALEKAIEMEPDEGIYVKTLARTYFFEDRYEEALGYFEEASKLEKKDEEIFYLMGECHYKLNQFEEAAVDYEEAYNMSSKKTDRKSSHIKIAECQYLLGNYDVAKETLTKHREEFKFDYTAVELLVQVHNARGEFEQADEYHDKMEDGKENGLTFPAELKKFYCIDRFDVGDNKVKVYRSYKDKSELVYNWQHKFEILDDEGEEVYSVETLLDTTIEGKHTYTICKIMGDTIMKYDTLVYRDDYFDYKGLRDVVKEIIAGKLEPQSTESGFEEWYANKKAILIGGDGFSFESAIMANSIPEEYEYLRENYPGHTFIMQSLVFHDDVPYDILTIKTEDGETLEIYFNISKFFGKY